MGRDFGASLNAQRAELRIDYVYNEEHPLADTPDFSDVLSIVGHFEEGRWGLRTDLAAGKGYAEQSDIWGLAIMPYYDQTAKAQWVLRYTYIDSRDPNGVRLGRYEREIVEGRGDRYNEVYLGFNYFFYGHKLKWQTGLQYAKMDETIDDGGAHEGFGFTTGFRISW